MDIITVLDSFGIQNQRTNHTTANDISVCCPFCEHDTNFFGNIRIADPHYFSCWYSAEHGTTFIHFLSTVTSLSHHDVKAALPMQTIKKTKERAQHRITGLPQAFSQITKSSRFDSHRKYLHSRGFTQAHIENLTSDFGLHAGAGEYKDRVIFPIYDKHNTVIAFQGRTTTNQQPKYLASKQSNGYASLSDNIWNANNCTGGKTLVIAEGIFDVIKLALSGVHVTALLGKTVSPKKQRAIRQISRTYKHTIYYTDKEVQHYDATQLACKIGARLHYPPNDYNDIGEIDFYNLNLLLHNLP